MLQRLWVLLLLLNAGTTIAWELTELPSYQI
jgi:hypothetical protein